MTCKFSPSLLKLLLGLLFLWAPFTLLAAGWHPGRLLVKPKQGVSLQEFHRTCAATLSTKIMAGNEAWELIEFNPLESVPDKARSYIKSGLVEYAHPDYWVELAVVPNDPHTRDAKRSYNIQLINAPAAWNLQHGAPNIIVAVVDTGIRYTHEDLLDNMWVNTGEIPGNKIDDDRNGYVDDIYGIDFSGTLPSGDPMDTSGHGTHVAGIIGACGNNAKGISGIAWDIKIMSCRFMGERGGTISGAVSAMVYARKNGARIINASWTVEDDASILRAEVNTLRSNGILLVCAAGNHTSNLSEEKLYPACYSTDYQNVICVGNSNSSDQKVADSNYSATYVQLFAPGREIYSTYAFSDNRYSTLSGTSMSTPHVSGALALYLQANPSANYIEARNRLLASVDPVPELKNFCSTGGRLNLARLLSSKEVPKINWPSPSSITYGTPLSTEQLNASTTVQGSFSYDPPAGTLLEPGSHSLFTTFTPLDTFNYLPTDLFVALTVSKRTPHIQWSEPEPVVYGTALSAEQLNATADTAGSFLYNPARGTVLKPGTHSLKATFIPSDSTHYNSAEETVSLTVEKALPQVLWSPPSPILAGSPLTENELNATANIPGTFTYSPALGSILPLGTHTLSASFVPDESDYYEELAQITNSITVVSFLPAPHPADLAGEFLMSESDVADYAEHWREGLPWPLAPSPIQVDFLTRAGFLWLSAEPYEQIPDLEPPLCWIPLSPEPLGEGIPAPYATSSISSNSVTIRFFTPPTGLYWALEETLPQGAIPSAITQNGSHDSAHNQLKWGPYWPGEDAWEEQPFSYTLAAEEGFASLVTLSGVLSLDGVNIPVLGERQLLLGASIPDLVCTVESAGKITLSWENLSLQKGKLELQKSAAATGPWEPLPEAEPPYTLTLKPSANLFFRLTVVDGFTPPGE